MREDANGQDPLRATLKRRIDFSRERDIGNTTVEQAVLKYGRPFIGMGRPKGYRQRAAKNCYLNSFYLADADRGVYVEGYALLPGHLFQHAWITIDGTHAVDVTLQDISDCQFFGIPFSLKTILDEIRSRGDRPFPLLDHAQPMETMEDLLRRATRSPPDFPNDIEPSLTVAKI
jgi:hypothetical protein